MKDRTCNWRRCESPVHSCGMCQEHYRQARAPQAKHKLTHKDTAGRRAHCSICGPVKLRILEDGKTRCRNQLYERPYARKMRAVSAKLDRPVKGPGRAGGGREPARAGYLRRRYGMSSERWDGMALAQNGLCAICGKAPTRDTLVVDHNHATGEVRGLLCTSCNTGIGLLGDDPSRLVTAAIYLQAFTSYAKTA